MKRTLIAGFGNVLRGDDGFGVAVLRRLADRGFASDAVELLDVGTGGIRLAQELITPFDRLIIVDAMSRSGSPGAVYVVAVDDVKPTREIDMHTAVPSRALEVARALGPLPGEIFLVGCEPASVDDLTTELSPPVTAAIDEAVHRIESLLAPDHQLAPDAAPDTTDPIARADELLELLYWFEGEGFRGAANMESIVRFTALSKALVARTLDRLIERGDVRLAADVGSPQYHLTVSGRREAARRFAAEFAPLINRGHGECNDPACDCHSGDAGGAECHARDHKHSH